MILLQKDQMRGFDGLAKKAREARLAARVTEAVPGRVARMGETGARALVKYLIDRADYFRIFDDEALNGYTDMVLVFGLEFDRDMRLPWAREILDLDWDDRYRAEMLTDGMLRWQARVRGAKAGQEKAACQAVASVGFERIAGLDWSSGGFDAYLAEVWPELLGALNPMYSVAMRRAAEETASYMKLERGGVNVVHLAQVMLGVGCFADPQYQVALLPARGTPRPERAAAVLVEFQSCLNARLSE